MDEGYFRAGSQAGPTQNIYDITSNLIEVHLRKVLVLHVIILHCLSARRK